jgi:hypothetical protein
MLALLKGFEVEVGLTDHRGLVEKSEDDGLFWVVIAQSFLIDFKVIKSIVFARLSLTLVQKVLLFVFYFV